MEHNEWTSVLEDSADGSGDLFLPIPEELLDELGWNIDDELQLEIKEDGSIVISR